MTENRLYFGYSEEEVLKVFNESEDQVDSNGRLCKDVTTLTQLAEASGQLIKENADLLYKVYNDIDE